MDKYPELIKKLYEVNLHGGSKLGLNNSYSLNKLLNHPEKHFKSIHIAGSNGKGSVSTKIAKALELQGYKVGLYTSPHISSFRERIRINRVMITEKEVELLLPQVFDAANQGNLTPTFFEITTSLAFYYFALQKVDIAVIETGLGGRLDATNVIQPLISIITSISLEHTEILGKSLNEITKEKAGIIKRDTPVVVGSRVPSEIIVDTCKSANSFLKVVDGTFDWYDDENTEIAREALYLLAKQITLTEKSIEEGIKIRPNCRFEIIEDPPCILDVAHNPDGIAELFKALNNKYGKRKFSLVLGFSKTKDIESCLKIMQPQIKHLYIVSASNGRGESPETIAQIALNMGYSPESLSLFSTPNEGIKTALQHTSKDAPVVICGTFFIMSEARKILGIHEDVDFLSLNELSSNIANNP